MKYILGSRKIVLKKTCNNSTGSCIIWNLGNENLSFAEKFHQKITEKMEAAKKSSFLSGGGVEALMSTGPLRGGGG